MEYNLRHRADVVSTAQACAKSLKAQLLIDLFESYRSQELTKAKSLNQKLANGNAEFLDKIKSQAKEIEGLRDILRRVDNEFENLSNLCSPEIVSPNDKLWEEIGKLLSQGTTTQPDKGSVMPTETDNTELNKPLKGKS
jgi:hypothetical protein